VEKFPATGLTFVLFDERGGIAGRSTPVLYAGGSDPKRPAVFRSDDAGVTWKPLPDQPKGFIVHHAAFDSAHALYLAYANGLGPNGVTNGAVWKFAPEEIAGPTSLRSHPTPRRRMDSATPASPSTRNTPAPSS